MKKYLLGTTLLLSSFLAPSSIANESKGFYLSVGGGIAFPSDSDGDSTLGGTAYDLKFETDNTGLFSVGIGKAFNDFRVEFNYSQICLKSNEKLFIQGRKGARKEKRGKGGGGDAT